MNEVFQSLDMVLADAAAHLQRAARDRRSPMHVPVVGTADGDLRMMVLRDCAPDLGLLRFHTDARSAKAGVIADGAPVSVLAFDPEAKLQLRLRGMGRIEQQGPVADAAWAAATPYARRCYLAEAGPGTPADGPCSGLPTEVEGAKPDEAQLLPARDNFAVLLIEPERIDWLYLAHNGHRRAQFARGQDGWQGAWVVP
ncbi:flavin-binding protein [Novosphingobium sp.]|uniref:flavin-binding protein n=1 Tax=Novosphingobium sp. TaxID=1874826 RepID=UPI0035B4B698